MEYCVIKTRKISDDESDKVQEVKLTKGEVSWSSRSSNNNNNNYDNNSNNNKLCN